MSYRQKYILVVCIILLAAVAIVEGYLLLRHSGLAGRFAPALEGASKFLTGSQSAPEPAEKAIEPQEDLVIRETAEDLENMQTQINRLFSEMTREMQFARQNFGRPDMFGRSSFNAFYNFERMQAEIDRIFRRAHESRHRGALELLERDWGDVDRISAMNIEERGTNYVVTLSLPGFDRADISINLDGRVLTVEAVSKSRETPRDSGSFRSGAYKTRLMLPEDVRGEEAQAQFKDSLLTITIPRKDPGNSLARRVTIM
ncbi:MAG: Hsp20/alpha crystallin family protein [Kiritimatiellia bacterium]